MGEALETLSVIVPIGPGDRTWMLLAEDLESLDRVNDIWLSAVCEPDESEVQRLQKLRQRQRAFWLVADPGRAVQMNAGARASSGQFLWFLHADSRLAPGTGRVLAAACRSDAERLLFFNLRFLRDGPRASRLNAWGAWLRSHVLRLPFGDQGFLLPRSLFDELGGFMPIRGEDHHLVWTAKRRTVPLQCLGAPIFSSARKYQTRGWLRTTAEHLGLTALQILREMRGARS